MEPITQQPPRGGAIAEIGGEERVLLLRHREIERWENKHTRGIYSLFMGVVGQGNPPTSTEVIDLLTLALVGGGMSDKEAGALMAAPEPGMLIRYRRIADAVLGSALMPDLADNITGDQDDTDPDEQKKNPPDTASAESSETP